jgi:hypothetical protein
VSDACGEWLCSCGNHIEDGFRRPVCGREPPWGCPRSDCEYPDLDDDEIEGWEVAMFEDYVMGVLESGGG